MRKNLFLALPAGLLAGIALAILPAQADDDETWQGLQQDVFLGRPIVEDAGLIVLEAPERAEDAALVPLTVRIAAAAAGTVKTVTLIIDKNPAPVAATFHFGPAAAREALVLSTRVRVNSYSSVRAVAEMADGRLVMAARFVKAAGGCSAPALKDADQALANLGKMQFRHFAAGVSADRAAQLMIRHPNNSGLQMDQLTGYYIPARFVHTIAVSRGGALVFRMEGGISLSEDPNIRFTYAPGDAGEPLEASATDTDGKTFTLRAPAKEF